MKELPIILKKLHGKRNSYTEEQIKTGFKKAGYKSSYMEYAYAIFMSKSKFEDSSIFNGDKTLYDCLRQEIANRFFRGNVKFSIHDLISNAAISERRTETVFDYRNVSGSELGGMDCTD